MSDTMGVLLEARIPAATSTVKFVMTSLLGPLRRTWSDTETLRFWRRRTRESISPNPSIWNIGTPMA